MQDDRARLAVELDGALSGNRAHCWRPTPRRANGWPGPARRSRTCCGGQADEGRLKGGIWDGAGRAFPSAAGPIGSPAIPARRPISRRSPAASTKDPRNARVFRRDRRPTADRDGRAENRRRGERSQAARGDRGGQDGGGAARRRGRPSRTRTVAPAHWRTRSTRSRRGSTPSPSPSPGRQRTERPSKHGGRRGWVGCDALVVDAGLAQLDAAAQPRAADFPRYAAGFDAGRAVRLSRRPPSCAAPR